jgi:hypothetical protein
MTQMQNATTNITIHSGLEESEIHKANTLTAISDNLPLVQSLDIVDHALDQASPGSMLRVHTEKRLLKKKMKKKKKKNASHLLPDDKLSGIESPALIPSNASDVASTIGDDELDALNILAYIDHISNTNSSSKLSKSYSTQLSSKGPGGIQKIKSKIRTIAEHKNEDLK